MKCKKIQKKIAQNMKQGTNINYKRKQQLKEHGVTMLSLVITIVVLLILSGITIKFALDDNGIIKQSRLASEKYKNSTLQEQIALNEAIKEMSKASDESTSGGDSGSSGSQDEIDDLNNQINDLQKEVGNLNDQINGLNNQIDSLKTTQATGNATASQVLSGATFSTSAGIGLTGTMKNNGAWTSRIIRQWKNYNSSRVSQWQWIY